MTIYTGRDKYEVYNTHGNRKKIIVNLKNCECSCRKYQLTRISCQHAMSCIRKMCFDLNDYVDTCFKKETYVRCYEHRRPATKLLYHFAYGHNKRTCPKKSKVEAGLQKTATTSKKATTSKLAAGSTKEIQRSNQMGLDSKQKGYDINKRGKNWSFTTIASCSSPLSLVIAVKNWEH
ncbi:hypothetical protein Ahy_B10g104907 [Arachis hypogaea]|uniref:SWIM-type domain-containing protein n=1 Tax=Arachis hypogaea TaxID=3818 RepID=A0A444X6N5_ARAHY|nr:hypothetical protein Ahy_B10g104907 [Arachis hypogaea]